MGDVHEEAPATAFFATLPHKGLADQIQLWRRSDRDPDFAPPNGSQVILISIYMPRCIGQGCPVGVAEVFYTNRAAEAGPY